MMLTTSQPEFNMISNWFQPTLLIGMTPHVKSSVILTLWYFVSNTTLSIYGCSIRDAWWMEYVTWLLSECWTFIHGIGGSIHSWISSFLDGHEQCFVVGEESTTNVPVESGVPQGKVPSSWLRGLPICQRLPAILVNKVCRRASHPATGSEKPRKVG